jgi:hypothetical protein
MFQLLGLVVWRGRWSDDRGGRLDEDAAFASARPGDGPVAYARDSSSSAGTDIRRRLVPVPEAWRSTLMSANVHKPWRDVLFGGRMSPRVYGRMCAELSGVIPPLRTTHGATHVLSEKGQ